MITLKELAQDPNLGDFLLEYASAMAVAFDSEDEHSQTHILHESNVELAEQKRIGLLRYIEKLVNEGYQ